MNAESVGVSNPTLANIGGLAANFVREQLATGLDLLSGLVLAFALVLAAATLILLGQYVYKEAI